MTNREFRRRAARSSNLSPAQEEHIVWARAVLRANAEGPATVRLRRGDHYENQLVHDALIRRGLLAVDTEGFTVVTEAGQRTADAIEALTRQGKIKAANAAKEP